MNQSSATPIQATGGKTCRKRITVIIPAFNEGDSVLKLHKALDAMSRDTGRTDGISPADFEWEFLFVNDGSRDNTLEILKELRDGDTRVCIVSLSRNFGKENALLAGMDYASGDAVVIMDADMQHPPQVVPLMIARWVEGYDDVYGIRRVRGKESWLRKKLTALYYRLLEKSTDIDVLPGVGDFRLLDRRVVDAIRSIRENDRYTKGLYCWVGFKKTGVTFDQNDSQRGESTFTTMGLLNLALKGLTGYTTSPLRISTVLGFAVSMLAFIYLAVVLGKTIFLGEPVRGYPTIMCVMLFLGGCQLLSLGIIGEYVGHIFNETRKRPPYIVDSFTGNTPEDEKQR